MTATTQPRVVALMPSWNAASFIAPTLASLAAQTYPNLEILISDDASDDATPAILEQFVATEPRARLLRQRTRRGWIGNVNELLREARGDCFFFAFHDDPLEPTYVARLVEALEQHPRAVLAYSDIFLDDRVERYAELEGVTDRVERGLRMLRQTGVWWIPNRGLFRASAANEVGGMRRHLAGEFSADWPWLLGLALRGEFVRVPEPLVRKNWRKQGLSRSWSYSTWQRFAVSLACMRETRHARLPWRDTLRLHAELPLHWLRRQWWQLHSPPSRASTGKDRSR